MKVSLTAHQAALQHRLQHNRAQIALQLMPGEPLTMQPPRSLTILFFRRHPGLATRLLEQGTTLLAGGRLLRYVSLALLMGRAVRGLTSDRRA